MTLVTVLIVAKAPVPGQVKTRLCPPLSLTAAADLAAAALLDTLDAAAGVPALLTGCMTGFKARVVVAVTGDLTQSARAKDISAALARCQLIPQRGTDFAARLIAAHADAGGGGPVLQIGMDTPQLTPELLTSTIQSLLEPDVDAVLGPAADGGWWVLGLKRAAGALVLQKVPMSHPRTYEHTLSALGLAGLNTFVLPTLTDVDTYDDACHVAGQAPHTRFAASVRLLGEDRRSRSAPSSEVMPGEWSPAQRS